MVKVCSSQMQMMTPRLQTMWNPYRCSSIDDITPAGMHIWCTLACVRSLV